jgi:hypothetical protein
MKLSNSLGTLLLFLLSACAQVVPGPESSELPTDRVSVDAGEEEKSPNNGTETVCSHSLYSLWKYERPTVYDNKPSDMSALSFLIYATANGDQNRGKILALKIRFERGGAGGPAGEDVLLKVVNHQSTDGPFTYYGFGSVKVSGQSGVVNLLTTKECSDPKTPCTTAPLGTDAVSGRYIMVLADMAKAGVGTGRFFLEDVLIQPHDVLFGACWLGGDMLRQDLNADRVPLPGRVIN